MMGGTVCKNQGQVLNKHNPICSPLTVNQINSPSSKQQWDDEDPLG